MSADQPTDIRLAKGVLSFDGRVVEAFGFLNELPYRIHVDQIRKVDYDGNQVRIRGIPSPNVDLRFALDAEDESKTPEVENLIDTVRRASPNLEEGQ